MKILPFLALAGVVLAAPAANASTFDPHSGKVRLDRDLLLSQSFDSLEALRALPARIYAVTRSQGYSLFTDTTETLSADAFAADAVAVEGHGALRVAGDRAVLLGDAASLSALAAGRVEVRLFARADGAPPVFHVVYGKAPLDAAALDMPVARVVAQRTGRATSDGWIELTSGPLDGSALGAQIAGILVTAEADVPHAASFVVDALEVRKGGGAVLSGGACRMKSEAVDCRAGATCVEGTCVDSALVYGALPPAETRHDLVARTIVNLTRFEQDRHGAAAAAAGFARQMPGIAATASSPLGFFRPFADAYARTRGAHTWTPAPMIQSRIADGLLVRSRATELNACFGVVERDRLGGGRGYAVYSVADPSPLAVGDVVDAIDGEPVSAWLDRVGPPNGLAAADPDSDPAIFAGSLSSLVMRYAGELVVRRCPATGECTAITVDVAAQRKLAASEKPLACSPRFQLAVSVPKGVDPDAYEAAIVEKDEGGLVSLHTNGEPPDDANWVAKVKSAFDSSTDRLLIDKRRGDGGGGSALETFATYVRHGKDFGMFQVARVDHAAIDGPPGFLEQILRCDGTSGAGPCLFGGAQTYPPAPGNPPKKIAWLNVSDGSASDMTSFFAKGAPSVRIFAPNRTMGLFGGLMELGGALLGWSGGSIQATDVRDGQTPAERVAGTWHSGRGIEPDELVVQLQSDLAAGRDTMLERARRWLNEP